MRGRLLKGVGIVKPRKRPAHFVWHRYRKEEADSAIRKHREDLKAQKIRLEKGKERMAALDVAPSAAGSSKATGTSASLPNNSNGVDITKDPTDSPEAEDEGGAVNKGRVRIFRTTKHISCSVSCGSHTRKSYNGRLKPARISSKQRKSTIILSIIHRQFYQRIDNGKRPVSSSM